MLALTSLALLAASSVAALPAAGGPKLAPRANGPSVTIQNGTIVGSSDASTGVDSFKGIPFAKPPTGTLRLKPPQTIDQAYGTFTSNPTPTACPQMSITGGTSSSNSTKSPEGEDCLTLNVQRPSNASATDALPVLFWIYGGGFEFGSTQMYDGHSLVRKSVELGQPIVFVAVNYRVGGFGFMGGKELQDDHSTNLGLRDQRLGLQWTSENIKAFGGDPEKVTIWGESAGSISVFDHLLINRGDNLYNGKRLFRGAIMDSGSAVPTSDVASEKPQAIYDMVVDQAGCSGEDDTLACLRSADYDTFNKAASSVPSIESYRALDLSYLPRYDPTDDFFPKSPETAAPDIARVPYILGDQEDEGTLFAITLNNVTTTDKLVTYLSSYFPDAPMDVVQNLVDLYPQDPEDGSPFRTGDSNQVYPGFKRLAAILGDITFTLTRRLVLTQTRVLSSWTPVWTYLSTYNHGTKNLGTDHSSDVVKTFFGDGSEAANATQAYYLSFVNHLDPNAASSPAQTIEWREWHTDDRRMMNFSKSENQIIRDDFREDVYQFLLDNVDVLHV